MEKNETLVFLVKWDNLGELGRNIMFKSFLGNAGLSCSTHMEAFVDSQVERNYEVKGEFSLLSEKMWNGASEALSDWPWRQWGAVISLRNFESTV